MSNFENFKRGFRRGNRSFDKNGLGLMGKAYLWLGLAGSALFPYLQSLFTPVTLYAVMSSTVIVPTAFYVFGFLSLALVAVGSLVLLSRLAYALFQGIKEMRFHHHKVPEIESPPAEENQGHANQNHPIKEQLEVQISRFITLANSVLPTESKKTVIANFIDFNHRLLGKEYDLMQDDFSNISRNFEGILSLLPSKSLATQQSTLVYLGKTLIENALGLLRRLDGILLTLSIYPSPIGFGARPLVGDEPRMPGIDIRPPPVNPYR